MYIFYYKNIIYIYVCVCVCVCEFYIYKVIDCDTVAIVVADVRTPRQCVAALCGVFRETRSVGKEQEREYIRKRQGIDEGKARKGGGFVREEKRERNASSQE